MRRLLCKSSLQAFKAGSESCRLGTDTKPEVTGHAEKLTRHDIGVVTLVEHIHEVLRIAALQAWKNTRSKLRPHAFEFVTAVEKFANKRSIFFEQRFGSVGDAIQI